MSNGNVSLFLSTEPAGVLSSRALSRPPRHSGEWPDRLSAKNISVINYRKMIKLGNKLFQFTRKLNTVVLLVMFVGVNHKNAKIICFCAAVSGLHRGVAKV